MSRKKPQPVTLLGPDGKPLDRAKYAPKPEPHYTVGVDVGSLEDATVTVTAKPSEDGRTFTFTTFYDQFLGGIADPRTRKVSSGKERITKPKPLADRVADDVAALTADFDGMGQPELPQPTPDLSAYHDALTAAVKSCPHTNVEDTIHSKGEYQCVDCGRYLSREDMRKRQASRGIWGMFG